MAISLTKGSNISLTKEAPGLSHIHVGLGWDTRSTTGDDFDLDASAILLNSSGKVRDEGDFIFYGQKEHSSGSVVHQGDNRTGAGDGDDEVIMVDLNAVPTDIEKIVISASIYEADKRNQNFGQVRNAYIRLLDTDNGDTEIVKYDLVEEAGSETALNFAELYRYNGEWKFRAVGQGYVTGLAGIASDFGVEIA